MTTVRDIMSENIIKIEDIGDGMVFHVIDYYTKNIEHNGDLTEMVVLKIKLAGQDEPKLVSTFSAVIKEQLVDICECEDFRSAKFRFAKVTSKNGNRTYHKLELL